MTRYRKLFPNEKLGTGMEEKGSMMNRTIKAAVGMVAIAAMSVGTLAACGGSSSSSDNGKGKVYFLNFKPESSDEWKKLAKDYTKETGVEVKVQTAASGTYEQTLKSEIAKSEAPTLFQSTALSATRTGRPTPKTCPILSRTSSLSTRMSPSRMGIRSSVFRMPWRLMARSTTRICWPSTLPLTAPRSRASMTSTTSIP